MILRTLLALSTMSVAALAIQSTSNYSSAVVSTIDSKGLVIVVEKSSEEIRAKLSKGPEWIYVETSVLQKHTPYSAYMNAIAGNIRTGKGIEKYSIIGYIRQEVTVLDTIRVIASTTIDENVDVNYIEYIRHINYNSEGSPAIIFYAATPSRDAIGDVFIMINQFSLPSDSRRMQLGNNPKLDNIHIRIKGK